MNAEMMRSRQVNVRQAQELAAYKHQMATYRVSSPEQCLVEFVILVAGGDDLASS